MVTLPNDGCKITSPVPYALFSQAGVFDAPFFTSYHVQINHLLCCHGTPLQPPSAIDPLPPSLTLLAKVCGLQRPLACVKEEDHADKDDATHLHKLPVEGTPALMCNPFPSPTLSPLGGSSLLAPSPESPQSIRGGYVLISPSTTASTLHSNSKDIGTADSVCSCDTTPDSDADLDYLLLHSNPTINAATIGRRELYNLHHMENFDPSLFRTQTVARLRPIPFVDGYFDSTASFSMSGNYHTTCFQPPNKYNASYL